MRGQKALFLAIIGGLLIAVCYPLRSQNPFSPLMIVAPAANTNVVPGQTIQVKVTRAANSGITAVAVHAFEWTNILQGADPLVFSVTIPVGAPPGQLSVIAADMTLKATPGVGVTSSPLTLNVQSPIVTSLRAAFPTVDFKFAGQTDWLPRIVGVSSSGTTVSLENSGGLTFASSDASIVGVERTGRVTALKPGQTAIVISYTNSDGAEAMTTLPVSVPAGIRGDVNGDGKVDIEDLRIIEGALNTPANGPNDARDLNHDGTVDALDARILTTLCTYPRCATHP